MWASGSEISSLKIALLGGGLENRPTFHRLFLAKNTRVSENLRTTYQLQTPILVGKDKSGQTQASEEETGGRLPRSSRQVCKCQVESVASGSKNVCIALPEKYIE